MADNPTLIATTISLSHSVASVSESARPLRRVTQKRDCVALSRFLSNVPSKVQWLIFLNISTTDPIGPAAVLTERDQKPFSDF